jgi:RNA polymerase sigma-70 factor (ECF subfamily)
VTANQQQEVFEGWLSQYKALLFKIVRAFAFTPMDQEDLFQEIVIRVWHSIPTFRQESAVSTWIYRISINTSIRWAGRERKHQQKETIDNIPNILQENKMEVDERLEWLYKEIQQLNEIDRSIALLLLEGFSYREMAVIVGISESNIGVKINRIKKQLISKKSKTPDYHGT